MIPLLTVQAAFEVDGFGLGLEPDLPAAVAATRDPFGVRVVRPDGTEADHRAAVGRVRVQGSRRVGARSAALRLLDAAAAEVPVGSVVLCAPAAYEAVTGTPVANGRTTPHPAVDVVAAVPPLGALRRRTVRLHPRQGEPLAGASGLGPSAPLWPAGQPLPSCPAHGALVPVLQLLRRDVPEVPFRDGERLFQLWWCPHDHPEAGPAVRAEWWTDLGALVPTPWAVPSTADPGYVPTPCRLHPERVAELPGPGDLSDGLQRAVRDHPAVQDAAAAWPYQDRRWRFVTAESRARMTAFPDQRARDADYFYQTCLSAAPGVKVGGHERWVQDPARPTCPEAHPMSFLLTLDSDECDAASLDRWLAAEDAGVWEGPTSERLAVQTPTGLALADGGNVHVYICLTCPGRPTATVHHSS